MRLFSIVVTFNGMRWYDRCLGSLLESETPVDIIVIDNASTDGSVAYIKAHFPEVCLIESHENLGFAKANNIGIRKALDEEADYVFLLNQDAWVEKDTISKLVQTFDDNENVGIAAPIHLNGSKSGLDYNFAVNVGRDFVSDAYMKSLKSYYEMQFVCAAAWLVSRKCIDDVGGFDTSLFKHYAEDDNYCQRVLFHGYKIVANTDCAVCHDREERKAVDGKYNELSMQTPFIDDKSYYGDINIAFDFKEIMRHLRLQMVVKVLKGRFNDARFLRSKIACYELIELSRKTNASRGRHWL